MKLVPKNWATFQHYKNRNPPWIKLHRALLNDRQYQRLPVASRALAPMLWLLAAESKDGVFDGSIEELAYRLRTSEAEIDAGLKPLIDAGFFIGADEPDALVSSAQREQVASRELASREQAESGLLAPRTQPATPETETETETETKGEGERADKPRRTPARQKSESKTLAAYLADCKAARAKPIPDDHAVRRRADDAGLLPEMLQIAWVVFRERYTEGEKGKRKRYVDWPAHFTTAVKDNWFKLWFAGDGGMAWTSTGLTHKTVLDARMEKREADHASA